MLLTGPFLIAFLIYAVYRIGRKKTPKTGKAEALLIDCQQGTIAPITIPADWNQYARTIGADTTTIGARGPGYVVFINERPNSFMNTQPSGAFRILGSPTRTFKGNGLVIGTGAKPTGLQVEILVPGQAATVIHDIG